MRLWALLDKQTKVARNGVLAESLTPDLRSRCLQHGRRLRLWASVDRTDPKWLRPLQDKTVFFRAVRDVISYYPLSN